MDNVYVIVKVETSRVIGAFEDYQEALETVEELNTLETGHYFMYSVDFYGKEL